MGTLTSGLAAAVTARGPATEGVTPVTQAASHTASRRPVYSGNRRVPGLYERELANGTTVYDAALRLGDGEVPILDRFVSSQLPVPRRCAPWVEQGQSAALSRL